MAKLFLSENDAITVYEDLQVFGANGNEVVKVSEDAGATIDQGVERVEFSQVLNNYTFALAGNVLSVNFGGELAAKLSIQGDGTTLAFQNGSADFVLTGLGIGQLGGTFVDATDKTLSGVNLDAFDVSNVTDLAGLGDRTVSVSATGIDDFGGDSYEYVDDANVSLVFTQGAYGYEVEDFKGGDALYFAESVALSIANTGVDGSVTVQATDSQSGTTVSVDVTGISNALDQTIFDVSSFKNAFGADSLVVGGNPSSGNTGGGNTGGTSTVNIGAIDANGTSSAFGGDVTFVIAQGNYQHTIDKFGPGDVLDILDSATPGISNTLGGDGTIMVEVADSSSGSVLSIALTGIDPALDGQVFNLNSFNATFGADVFI